MNMKLTGVKRTTQRKEAFTQDTEGTRTERWTGKPVKIYKPLKRLLLFLGTIETSIFI
jgi:hypothetical protein